MSVQIIHSQEGEKSRIETISNIRSDAPQISYNNEGRIAIRIPLGNGADDLIVLDRAVTRELIWFIKNCIIHSGQKAYCAECAKELPF